MRNRLASGVAWVLLFAACILAAGGSINLGRDHSVTAAVGVIALACVSNFLFRIGGYRRSR